MPATKRFMNWTGVAFTPSGGTATPITGVTSVAIDTGGSLAKFSGDGDRYNTTVVNDFNEPVVTVQAADLAAVRANPVGDRRHVLGDAQRRPERRRDGRHHLHARQRGRRRPTRSRARTGSSATGR